MSSLESFVAKAAAATADEMRKSAAQPTDRSRIATAAPARALRVLCLNYEYPPMGGGAGNATYYTARELARRGHHVHVLTSRLPAQPEVECVDAVTVCRVKSWRRSLHQCGLLGALSYILFAFFKLVRLARAYDYDLYHFYFSLPTALLAPYVRLVLRKPYIIALRGSDVPGYDEHRWYMRPLHRLLRPISRHLWRHASAVTTLSKDLQALARETLPDLKSVVIPNGVDPERFPAKGMSPSVPAARLITVCRLVRRKGLEYLIDAMSELKHDGVVLELVGSGEDQNLISELIRRRDLASHVLLSGYVRAERLSQCFHAADIFVLPSLSESFGQVLLEAMSCGLPVVATTVGGIPETVRHGLNGLLVPPRDAAALVSAIRELAAAPAKRVRMGRRNEQQARERYSWESVARSYETLYYRAVVEAVPSLAALGVR